LKITNILTGFRLLTVYIHAQCIIKKHYDKKYIESSSFFCGGKYGAFTASGWRWLINDYKACRKIRVNRDVPWPVSPQIRIVYPENIVFHPDDLNNFQGFGNYFQAIGKITIGHGTYIAPNVGIITSNHTVDNLDEHDEPKPVTLGERCWIGMNSMILPGVTLGEHTVVGAGSVVTKSFPNGNCVIAGNPAKIIRLLDGGKIN
jgi:acetyltransferase-like isoleucine patch superfamily enzyme